MSPEEIETGIQNCYEKIFHTSGNIRDLVFLKDMPKIITQLKAFDVLAKDNPIIVPSL